MMGSVGDELLVARLRADESRRWRRGASMASWAAPKWGSAARPRDASDHEDWKRGRGKHTRPTTAAPASFVFDAEPPAAVAASGRCRVDTASRSRSADGAPAVARVGVDGVRRGPLATHRVPRERDAKTPRRGSTRAKSKRTPQANRAARRRRRRGAATAARPGSCAGKGVAMRRYEEGRGPVQRGKRKRDLCTQRRVRRQEARQDREYRDAEHNLQRARAARRRAGGGGALPGQRPARHARALVDVVGVARGGVDVGVPAVPVAVQHHLDCPAAAALDSSAGAQVPQQRRAGRGRVLLIATKRRGVSTGPGRLI